jgi:N-acetyl-alpha-D-glucosaminyl L-malate synthase BshA
VIPNFINSAHYWRRPNEELRASLAPAGEPLIMHVSNFRPVKRIDDCVHAFARIRKHVRSRLVMCGDGPAREGAEKLAADYNISDDVLFIGQVPNIADYLSVADLLLITSETESFGLAALEALACEVPVIATRVGGLPEVVRDGENGYLVGVGDVDAMAEWAVELLVDSDRRREFGRVGREWAVAQYNTEHVIPQYIALYENVLRRGR